MTQNNQQNNHNQQGNNGYQRNNRYQGNGYQRNFSSNGYDPTQSEQMRLKGKMRGARQELAQVDVQMSNLTISRQQLDAAITAHQSAIPGVASMEIGRLASKAIGFPFLPPVYRNWYYKNERLHELKNNQMYQEARLFKRREAINLRIQDLQTDLDLLKNYPDQYWPLTTVGTKTWNRNGGLLGREEVVSSGKILQK